MVIIRGYEISPYFVVNGSCDLRMSNLLFFFQLLFIRLRGKALFNVPSMSLERGKIFPSDTSSHQAVRFYKLVTFHLRAGKHLWIVLTDVKEKKTLNWSKNITDGSLHLRRILKGCSLFIACLITGALRQTVPSKK